MKNPEIKNFLSNTAYFIWDILKTIAVVIVLFLIIRFYVVQPFIVEGKSMEPTLSPYEYLIIEKISYRLHPPSRGDIIVFDYPKNPKIKFIKRVIALPGEKIVIKKGKVFIYNEMHPEGVQLQENYLPSFSETSGNISLTLKEDEYFVLGDNRENSSDSRTWGALLRKNIVGRACIILFPFNKMGLIKTPIYENLTLLIKKLAYR